MNEELTEKAKNLLQKLKKSNERKREIEDSISELEAKSSTLTSKEAKRLENLKKEYDKIGEFAKNYKSKYVLYVDYLNALELIDIIKSDTNKSVKTKHIKALKTILDDLKTIDGNDAFTKEENESLLNNRNNEIVFNDSLDKYASMLNNYALLIIYDINKELDNLDKKEIKFFKGNVWKKFASLALAGGIIFGAFKLGEHKDDLGTKVYNNDNNKEISELATIVTPTPVPTETPLYVAEPEVTFNPNTDKDADIQRRANLIAGTNFFTDLYNSDIVNILNAINNKDLFSSANAGYAQLFRNKLNQITEHYMNDIYRDYAKQNGLDDIVKSLELAPGITEKDIASLDAFRNMAKDNSDLDRFLETYITILQHILTEPTNQYWKDYMAEYLKVFTEHLAGFTSPQDTENYLTSDPVFNENAIVNDFYDAEMAWYYAVEPVYNMFYPANVFPKVDGAWLESVIASGNFEGLSEDVLKYIDLVLTKYRFDSALLNHPQYCQITGYDYENTEDLVRGLN